MSRQRPEVADVLRDHGSEFLRQHGRSLSSEQRRVLADIVRCRTAALGGHKLRCEHNCGHEEMSYNSCNNRHCPKCLASAQADWLQNEARSLLDIEGLEYYHVVFTLPAQLGPLALSNKRRIYGALLRAAAQSLSTIARDPKHLGAEIGFLAVLHTWGQNLQHHPHVHCVVAGGGLSPDGTQWIPCRKGFFLPVRVLSRRFRNRFLQIVDSIYRSGELRLTGKLSPLSDPAAWAALLDSLRSTEWVVYSKSPFGGPCQALKYLARYTHRVAISNRRLLSLRDGKVRFTWKDYAHEAKRKIMELDAHEFIRRFLLHVLPTGFVRIRHYGFLANRSRKAKLELIRRLTAPPRNDATPEATAESPDPASTDDPPSQDAAGGTKAKLCPRCKRGRLVPVETLPPTAGPPFLSAISEDTS
jgi:hypothetical protein